MLDQSIIKFICPEDISEADSPIRPEEQSILDEVNQKVAAAMTLEQVMDFIFEETRSIFPCDRLAIVFAEEGGKRLVSRWTRADYEPLLLKPGYSEGIHGSTLKEVLDQRCVRIISDLEAYSAQKPDSLSSMFLVQEGVRSSMTCPLTVEDRPIGLFFRSSRQPHAYDDYQVLLHFKMAERLAQAVEKTYRIDQLSTANKAYMEMLGFASHELKSPLATIIMQGSMMLDGYFGELSPDQRNNLERMVKKAESLVNLTKEYLDLARYESGNLRFTPEKALDFKASVLAPVLEDFEAPLAASNCRAEVECSQDPLVIDCDPALMKIVFTNLIGNAIKYGKNDSVIRISLNTSAAKLIAKVRNEGTGFPPEQRDSLFKRFSRLDVPEFQTVKGTGVGLYITWQIIQLHQGRIWADSEYGSWAEFSFEIPLASLEN